ncbi:hypothetical protein C8Q72DRAFT_888598 [Fomitopsis betulina]|nr:hypothetical protein C8Q72DRAFT_888598 [Fomitopsis betulina]
MGKAAGRGAEGRAQQAAAERQLREGVRPVVTTSPQQIHDARQGLQYREGDLHVAVASSGMSSLIDALRGIRNGEPGTAKTGIVETTSVVARYPDLSPGKRVVWYDVPGAGTLSVPDWVYFTDQACSSSTARDCVAQPASSGVAPAACLPD